MAAGAVGADVRTNGLPDDMGRPVPKDVDERRQIVRVQTQGVVGTVAAPLVGIVVAPAVGDHAVALRKRFELVTPRPVVTYGAVHEDDWIAGAELEVVQLGAVGSQAPGRQIVRPVVSRVGGSQTLEKAAGDQAGKLDEYSP